MDKKETKEILETVIFIKDYMMKKFDQIDGKFDGVDARFDGVDARFDRIETELHEMHREFSQKLIEVRSDIENLQQVTGYAKEIDLLLERVAHLEKAFEKHVTATH